MNRNLRTKLLFALVVVVMTFAVAARPMINSASQPQQSAQVVLMADGGTDDDPTPTATPTIVPLPDCIGCSGGGPF